MSAPDPLRRRFCLTAALLPTALPAAWSSGCAQRSSRSETRAPSQPSETTATTTLADHSPAASSNAPAQVSQLAGPGLVLHGGAGTIPRDMPPEIQQGYVNALEGVLRLGLARIEQGQDCIDVAEAVIVALEDHPLFNAGHGAVYTAEGKHELDAAIMRGQDLSCGAVTGLTTVKNPIRLARAVMEQTKHVLLSGQGAEAFANEVGIERVENTYFDTEHRFEAWQRANAERDQQAQLSAPERDALKMGTVGCAVMDRKGKLAAATSTGGMTNKMYGRVGDVPIIGAGTYANDACCAISCTGHGEQFIRHNVAHEVSALMRHREMSLQEAADAVIHGVLSPGDGGLIAIDRHGQTVFSYNSAGMYRARANLGGPLEAAIWEAAKKS